MFSQYGNYLRIIKKIITYNIYTFCRYTQYMETIIQQRRDVNNCLLIL